MLTEECLTLAVSETEKQYVHLIEWHLVGET